MVDCGLSESDRVGGVHHWVDVGVFGERRVTRVFGLDQNDFEHSAVPGDGVDVVVHSVHGEFSPADFGVHLKEHAIGRGGAEEKKRTKKSRETTFDFGRYSPDLVPTTW